MRLNTVNILGVHITSTSADVLLREIIAFVAKPASPETNLGRSSLRLVVFTPNPEFLVSAAEDLSFRELLNRADINLPDGVGLIWASRILGTPIKERVSGADVVEKLLEIGNEKCEVRGGRLDTEAGSGNWTIGIAGARRENLAESTELIKSLKIKYSDINFVNLDNTKYKIQNTKYNLVFAAHGMKKQEQWIMENKDKINTKIFMGIGGSLDFITGFSKRAPLLMQQVGLEWLWRGLQRPEHFKRIWRAVFVFGWLVLKERVRKLF